MHNFLRFNSQFSFFYTDGRKRYERFEFQHLKSIFQYTKKKFHYIRGFQQGVIRHSQLTHYYPLSLFSGIISVAAGITSNDVYR